MTVCYATPQICDLALTGLESLDALNNAVQDSMGSGAGQGTSRYQDTSRLGRSRAQSPGEQSCEWRRASEWPCIALVHLVCIPTGQAIHLRLSSAVTQPRRAP